MGGGSRKEGDEDLEIDEGFRTVGLRSPRIS